MVLYHAYFIVLDYNYYCGKSREWENRVKCDNIIPNRVLVPDMQRVYNIC